MDKTGIQSLKHGKHLKTQYSNGLVARMALLTIPNAISVAQLHFSTSFTQQQGI